VPDAPGALAAPLKLALRPLESLKSQLSVVSGLEIPVQDGGNVPPGSRIRGGFHYTTTGPLVSGTHNTSEFDSQALSESSDVIMTRTLSAGTRVPHLVYRAQALEYKDYNVDAVSWNAPTTRNGHSYSSRTLAQTISWHTKHLANLLQKLRDTPEATGTLLDHTVVVFLMEGGAGPAAPHTSERMAALVCGGSSLGLRLGQHVVTARAHPASVLLTAMQAAGSPASALGEITSGIPQLRV
jgi:hypothetical protein